MTQTPEFETALQRLETAIKAMIADGIPRETALDAAVMLGLGEKTGVAAGANMRAILQISAPGEDAARSKILHRMYHGFSTMLVARKYPLAQIAAAALAWGHAGAMNTVGPEVTAETLRMLADSDRAEGMN